MARLLVHGTKQKVAGSVETQRINPTTCQALSRDGVRCVRTDTEARDYFGETELYYGDHTKMPEYVRIYLCGHHRDEIDAPVQRRTR